jgi:glycosyltransferase involved in cell wall biosynthesis
MGDLDTDLHYFNKVTFALYSYNQESYIREAVESVLNQDFPSMEIILSDDCSSDKTYEIMQEAVKAYTGHHKVILIKNPVNLGIANHYNNVLKKASGDIIINAAGDDISMPNRAQIVYSHLSNKESNISAIYSNVEIIDSKGESNGVLFKNPPFFSRNIEDFKKTRICWAHGSSLDFRKILFEKYGKFNPELLQEDGVIAFRALLEGNLEYVNMPLVKYRIHGSNISQTDSPGRRLKLQKKSYLLKASWLKDAALSENTDKVLMKILRRELFYSKIKSFFFTIPVLGFLYNALRISLKKCKRYINHFHSNEKS